MKKGMAFLLALVLILGCTACGSGNGDGSNTAGKQGMVGSATEGERDSDPQSNEEDSESEGSVSSQEESASTQEESDSSQEESVPRALEPITSGYLLARERDESSGASTWYAYDLFGREMFRLEEVTAPEEERITELCEYQNGNRIVYNIIYEGLPQVLIAQSTIDGQDRLLSQAVYTGLPLTNGYSFEKQSEGSGKYSDDGMELYGDQSVSRFDEFGNVVYSETHSGDTTFVTEYEYDEFGNVVKIIRENETDGEVTYSDEVTYQNEYDNGLLTKSIHTTDFGSSFTTLYEYYNVEDGYEDVYTGMWTEKGGDGFLMISLVNGLYCMGYRDEAGCLCMESYGEYYNSDGETAELSCDYTFDQSGITESDGDSISIELQGDTLIVDGIPYVKQG